MVRKTLALLSAAAVIMTISACQTVKGLGRDIESVGQAGSDVIHR